MFGKAMISTEIGTGTSYVNVDGETGLVVPASDQRALREAMGKLWGDDVLAFLAANLHAAAGVTPPDR